jgi:membrane fusion protein, copper/silver efflux system
MKNIKPGLALLSILTVILSCTREPAMDAMKPKEEKGFLLSEAQMQLANIRVAAAERGKISHNLILTGVIKVDEQSVSSVSSRLEGRIEKLYFKTTGGIVRKGDALYDVYSEQLYAVMREYKSLQDNNWNTVRRTDITLATENKLLLLGMTKAQIDAIYTTKFLSPTVTIFSPGSGIIRSVGITEGQYIAPGDQLFELADDNKLWVEAQVYPNELQLLKPGMPADVIVPGAGELTIPNRISFINPAFEPGTNITLIRTVIDNPGEKLHPGMLSLLRIHTAKSEGIVIPASAMLIGKNGTHVWVQNEDGTFLKRKILTGIQSSDSVLVVAGLEEGEAVVVSGAYLIDSEEILKKGYQSMSESDISILLSEM